MKSLVQLVSEVSLLEEKLIESAGEITPEIEAMLMVSSDLLPLKVDNYSMIMERFGALADHYKERAKFFQTISKQCENVQDRLKENIKFALKEMGTDEIAGQDIRFKLQRVKPKLIIDDESKIPKEYKRETIVIDVDKDRLKGDLEIGHIEGAHLEESFSLKTYANTPKKKEKVS